MADFAIKEYVTPMSKRAAAISTTFSIVYLLYLVGWVELDTAGKLPITNIPVREGLAPYLFYAAMVIAFAMWGWRFDNERRYQGSIIQEGTISANTDFESIQNTVRINLEALMQQEKTIKHLITDTPKYSQHFNINKDAEDGFQVTRTELDNPSVINAVNWNQYEGNQQSLKTIREKLIQANKNRGKARGIEAGLNLHSRLAYEWAPLIAFYAVLAGESVRLFL